MTGKTATPYLFQYSTRSWNLSETLHGVTAESTFDVPINDQNARDFGRVVGRGTRVVLWQQDGDAGVYALVRISGRPVPLEQPRRRLTHSIRAHLIRRISPHIPSSDLAGDRDLRGYKDGPGSGFRFTLDERDWAAFVRMAEVVSDQRQAQNLSHPTDTVVHMAGITFRIDASTASRLRATYQKPAIECPACGHDRGIATIYGYPGDSEIVTASQLGLLRIGGCMIEGGEPTLECDRCGEVLETLDDYGGPD